MKKALLTLLFLIPAAMATENMIYALKIEHGRAVLYNAANSSYQRSFGSDIVQGSVSGDLVAVVRSSGRVEIYKASTGSYQRSFCSDAVSAQIQDDLVAVTRKNGRVEIYKASTGSYQRSL